MISLNAGPNVDTRDISNNSGYSSHNKNKEQLSTAIIIAFAATHAGKLSLSLIVRLRGAQGVWCV